MNAKETLAGTLASFDRDVLGEHFADADAKPTADDVIDRYMMQLAFVAGAMSVCTMILSRQQEGDPFAIQTTREEARELYQKLNPDRVFKTQNEKPK